MSLRQWVDDIPVLGIGSEALLLEKFPPALAGLFRSFGAAGFSIASKSALLTSSVSLGQGLQKELRTLKPRALWKRAEEAGVADEDSDAAADEVPHDEPAAKPTSSSKKTHKITPNHRKKKKRIPDPRPTSPYAEAGSRGGNNEYATQLS